MAGARRSRTGSSSSSSRTALGERRGMSGSSSGRESEWSRGRFRGEKGSRRAGEALDGSTVTLPVGFDGQVPSSSAAALGWRATTRLQWFSTPHRLMIMFSSGLASPHMTAAPADQLLPSVPVARIPKCRSPSSRRGTGRGSAVQCSAAQIAGAERCRVHCRVHCSAVQIRGRVLLAGGGILSRAA